MNLTKKKRIRSHLFRYRYSFLHKMLQNAKRVIYAETQFRCTAGEFKGMAVQSGRDSLKTNDDGPLSKRLSAVPQTCAYSYFW